MSAMKRFAEDVSASMGLGGELTGEVLEEASRRLIKNHSHCKTPGCMEPGTFQPYDWAPNVRFCETHAARLIVKTVESILTTLPTEQPTATSSRPSPGHHPQPRGAVR